MGDINTADDFETSAQIDRKNQGPRDIDLYLGKRLRRRRRLLGLTQQQLALAVGMRFQQIQKYECGANRISAGRLFDLAKALETPINYFYEGYQEKVTGLKSAFDDAKMPKYVMDYAKALPNMSDDNVATSMTVMKAVTNATKMTTTEPS